MQPSSSCGAAGDLDAVRWQVWLPRQLGHLLRCTLERLDVRPWRRLRARRPVVGPRAELAVTKTTCRFW